MFAPRSQIHVPGHGRRNSENELQDEGPSEAELYERFAKLSASHANGEMDDETFEEKKEEIFELLGVQLH